MNTCCLNRHRGAALLVFLLVALTMGGAIGLTAINNAITNSQVNNYQHLQQAKEALVGYALAYADTHANSLPAICPVRTLTVMVMLNSLVVALANQRLVFCLGEHWAWLHYGMILETVYGTPYPGAYKAAPLGALSTEANGQLLLFDAALNSLNGAANSDAGIAIVFAPGKVVPGQSRSVTPAAATKCGSNVATDGIRQAQNFMETRAGINNANGFYGGMLAGVAITAIPSSGYSAFITADMQDSFNDALTLIRPSDFQAVYQRMQQWVGERVRRCLVAYQTVNGGKLPWPALLDPLVMPVYSDNNSSKRFGRIPANLANSAAAGLNPSWPADPQQPASQCFNWSWWPNFSETVFYGLDLSISPAGSAASPTLTLDTLPVSGVVMVSGRISGSQTRTGSHDKGTLANYLETANIIDAGAGMLPPGDDAFVSLDNSGASFNDYVCTLAACP